MLVRILKKYLKILKKAKSYLQREQTYSTYILECCQVLKVCYNKHNKNLSTVNQCYVQKEIRALCK